MDRAKLLLVAATAAVLAQPGQSFSVQGVLDYAKAHLTDLASTSIDESDPAIVSAAKVYEALDQKSAAATADGLGEIVKGLSGTFQSLDMSFNDLSKGLFDLADAIEQGKVDWTFSTTEVVDPEKAPAAAAVNWTPPPNQPPSKVDNMYSPLQTGTTYRIVVLSNARDKYPEVSFPDERVFNAVYQGDETMDVEDSEGNPIEVWGRRLEDDGFPLTLPADAVKITLTEEDQAKADKSIQDQIDALRMMKDKEVQDAVLAKFRGGKTRRKKHPRKK